MKRPRRRRVGIAGAALVLAAALALAGCGQSSSSRRPRLVSYLKSVQHVETEMKQPLAAVGRAGHTLVGGGRSGTSSISGAAAARGERVLRSSIARQRSLRARLAALPAPPEASHLRSLLLELANRQLSLTRELVGVVVFLPRFAAVMSELAPATRRLQHVLAAHGTYAASAVGAAYTEKAASLRAFQAAVTRIAARVERLKPPAVSRPGWRTQLESLRRMSASAGRLAAQLQSGSPSGVPKLLLAFDRAAALSRTTAAQKAQIAAVHAYTRAVRSVRRLVVAVDRERSRLDRAVT